MLFNKKRRQKSSINRRRSHGRLGGSSRLLRNEQLEDRLLLTTFTRTSPMGDLVPAGVTEVGGVVLDMLGSNGARIVSQLSASSLFSGFASSNPITIGTQTGFNSSVTNALGGGIAQLAVRITLFDGDTGPGNFDDNQNTLRLNGISVGNFSNVVTQETNNSGTSLISTNSSGGFRNGLLDTGWFHVTNTSTLSSIYSSLLSNSEIAFQLFDIDPGDNFFDFTAGVSGGLVNVGQPPNVAPVISSVVNSGPINEGSSVTITVNASDPDSTSGGLTYEFDLDNNGSYEVSNTSGVASRSFGDNGSFTINVRVSDTRGGVDTDSTAVVVNNVAPVLELDPVAAINEDGVATLSGRITDPGSPETLTLSLNWGDPASPGNTQTIVFGASAINSGGITWNPTARTFSITHQYLDDNPSGTPSDSYTISAALDDGDGGTAMGVPVTITSLIGDIASTDFNNATSAVFATIVANELSFATTGIAHSHGGSVDIFVEVHNPSTSTWTEVYRQTLTSGATFNFNGLTIPFAAQAVNRVRLGSSPGQNQTYHNWFSLALSVVGGSPSATVQVSNVPPVADAGADQTVNEGDFVTLNGTFTDVGLDDSHSQEWTVVTTNGDVIPPLIIPAGGDSNGSGGSGFGFTPGDNGTYTVTYKVTDDDGGVHSDTAVITVNNVAPVMGALSLSPAIINEDGSVTASGSFFDPGTLDTHAIVIDWNAGGNVGGPGEGTTTITTSGPNPAGATLTDMGGGNWSFTATHKYLDDHPTGTASDSYRVSAALSDDDDTAATSSLIVFQFEGQVVEADLDFDAGDKFIGSYTFNPLAAGLSHPDTNTLDRQYPEALVAWQLSVPGKGYRFEGVPLMGYVGGISVGNDQPFAGGFDRYIVTLDRAGSFGAALPSGRTLSFAQFDIQDEGNPPDLLSDDSVQTSPPDLALSSRITGGRFRFSDNSQPPLLLTRLVGKGVEAEVQVNNIAPTLVLSPVADIDENGVATLTGTITDPGTLDWFTLAIDWGDSLSPSNIETYIFGASSTGSQTFTLTHHYLDDSPTATSSDSYTISATVTDDDSGVGSDTETVTVRNETPTLILNSVTAIDENGLATLSGEISDPGILDTFTLSIDWGDPLSPNNVETYTFGPSNTGNQVFSLTHQYVDDNPTATPMDSYTISATLADDDGGSVATGTGVTLDQAFDPVVNPHGQPGAVGADMRHSVEGHRFEKAQTFTVGLDGTLEAFDFYLLKGPHGTITEDLIIEIRPTVAGAPSPSSVLATVTIPPSAVTSSFQYIHVDVSSFGIEVAAGDVLAVSMRSDDPIGYTWYGLMDGLATYAGGQAYARNVSNPDISWVPVTWDLLFRSYVSAGSLESPTVHVSNVAPEILTLAATSVDENGVVHLTGTYHDDGTQDTHTLTINWGEGGPETVAVSGGTFDLTHQYLDDNPTGTPSDTYTISATLTDDDTGSNTVSTSTLITNVAPTITAIGNSSPDCGIATEGEAVSITGTFTDTGTLDTHTATIDWGDGTTTSSAVGGSGTSVTESAGSGSFYGSHVYVNGGIYNATLTLADDDSGAATTTTQTIIVGAGVVDGVLYVIGTGNDDHVTVNRVGNSTFRVHADFLPTGSFKDFAAAGVDLLMAFLCEGNDHMSVAGNISLPTLLHGGGGDDHLNGGGYRSLMIGGLGQDRLVTGNGEGVLVGGSTAQDDDLAALRAALAAWANSDPYADRIDEIQSLLDAWDDEESDALTGGSGRDLYFDGLGDQLTGVVSSGSKADTVIGLV